MLSLIHIFSPYINHFMKNKIKFALIFTVSSIMFSCNNDDNATDSNTTLTETESALIGEWLRADNLITPNTEYKINLYNDNSKGLITEMIITEAGIISSANELNWSVHNEMLSMVLDDDTEISSSMLFLPNGNLLLAEMSAFPFIKQ